MSLDARIKWTTIAAMAALTAAVAAWKRLPIALGELAIWLGLIATAAAGSRYCRRRGLAGGALCLHGLVQVLAFGCAYIAVMYLATMPARPLIDDALMRFDAAVGIHVPDLMAWARRHPIWDALLTASYHTVQLQTLVVVAAMGLRGERQALESCLLRLLIAAVVTLALFAAFPAAGPFTEHGYGFEPSPYQQAYLDLFYGYRSGEMSRAAFYNREGLIVFPSFHTAWAVILAAAWVHRRRLFLLFASLNAAVVVSTMTTGMHYFADVLAGIAVAGFAIGLTRLLRGRLYPAHAPSSQDALDQESR